MFTQLFGQYLLNKNAVTRQQLHEAMSICSKTKARLGALAIASGYMDASQVEEVHESQKSTDKRFGDLAVELGYLTDEQVSELLGMQKNSNLVLGQALIDLGFVTAQGFEEIYRGYKNSSAFVDERSDDDSIKNDIISVLDLSETKDNDLYARYMLLLVRNFIRFLGDDFTFGGALRNTSVSLKTATVQKISGEINVTTVIGGDDAGIIGIASRYAGENLTEPDEYTKACAGEFLNLQNGLFLVNTSNDTGVELTLEPQTYSDDFSVEIPENGICVKLSFVFGDVSVIVIKN